MTLAGNTGHDTGMNPFLPASMQYFLNTALILAILCCTGSAGTAAAAEARQAGNTVSGVLHLFLPRRDAIGLYVRLELRENDGTADAGTLADSGFLRISEHPFPFALAYPPASMHQDVPCTLIITVAEDPEGTAELAGMSVPVLTQGYPATVDVAIHPPPEPVE